MTAASYTAYAQLNVQSNAAAVLASIGRALGTVDGRIRQTERSLQALTGRFSSFNAAANSANTLGAAMQGLQGRTQAVAIAAAGVSQAMTLGAVAMDRSAQAAMRVTQAATGAAAALRAMSTAPAVAAPRGFAGGGGGGHSRLGEAVAAGAAGRGIMQGLFVAGSLQHEEAVLRAQTGPADAGFRDRVMQRAVEMAATIRGTTVQRNYSMLNELRTVLGGQEESLHFGPKFAEIAAGLSALTGRSADDVVGGLGRAMTLRGSFVNPRTGQLDAERGMAELELAGRMLMAFRDKRMDPDALLLYQKQARVAGAQLRPEDFFGGFVASGIQAMGGARFGTGHAAFYRQMVTGIMTKAQAEQMQRFGLLSPDARGARVSGREIDAMVRRGEISDEEAAALRQGSASRFARRHIVGGDLAARSPELWRQFVEPILRQRLRTMLGREPTQQDIIAAQAAIGATEVSRGFLQWLFNPAERAPDIAAVNAVQPGAFSQLLREDFNVAVTNLGSAFTNLLTAIGRAATDDLIAGMDALAVKLNAMAQWARENPETARIIGDVAAAFSVMAIAAAGFAAGSLALSGLTGLGTALGGLAAAAVVGGIAALVSPTGLALLGASIVGLAANMEGKDWAALFANLDGIFTRIGRYLGVTPGSRSESGSMPEYDAAGNPTGRMIPLPPVAPRPNNPWAPPGFSDPSGSGFQLQNFVPPGSGGGGQINLTLEMDQRRVGQIVLEQITRQLDVSRWDTSIDRMDSRMNLPMPSSV